MDCQVGRGYKTDKSEDYKGNARHTLLGKQCQTWSSDFPQDHEFNDLQKHMYDNDLIEDWCRNGYIEGRIEPETGVWCYTLDKEERWDYCPVRRCSDCDTGGYLLPSSFE